MTVEDIARVCHEVNAAYCLAWGDSSQPSWDDASDSIKESAVKGVKFRLDNPTVGAEAQHNSWLEDKKRDGWKYGPEKNEAAKEHPCFVVFDELPEFQKGKDYIFKQVVNSLRGQLSPLSDYGDHTSTQ